MRRTFSLQFPCYNKQNASNGLTHALPDHRRYYSPPTKGSYVRQSKCAHSNTPQNAFQPVVLAASSDTNVKYPSVIDFITHLVLSITSLAVRRIWCIEILRVVHADLFIQVVIGQRSWH